MGPNLSQQLHRCRAGQPRQRQNLSLRTGDHLPRPTPRHIQIPLQPPPLRTVNPHRPEIKIYRFIDRVIGWPILCSFIAKGGLLLPLQSSLLSLLLSLLVLLFCHSAAQRRNLLLPFLLPSASRYPRASALSL